MSLHSTHFSHQQQTSRFVKAIRGLMTLMTAAFHLGGAAPLRLCKLPLRGRVRNTQILTDKTRRLSDQSVSRLSTSQANCTVVL